MFLLWMLLTRDTRRMNAILHVLAVAATPVRSSGEAVTGTFISPSFVSILLQPALKRWLRSTLSLT